MAVDTKNNLYIWGSNVYKQLGIKGARALSPVKVPIDAKIDRVDGGE